MHSCSVVVFADLVLNILETRVASNNLFDLLAWLGNRKVSENVDQVPSVCVLHAITSSVTLTTI
jgi:hypothetical protein